MTIRMSFVKVTLMVMANMFMMMITMMIVTIMAMLCRDCCGDEHLSIATCYVVFVLPRPPTTSLRARGSWSIALASSSAGVSSYVNEGAIFPWMCLRNECSSTRLTYPSFDRHEPS